MLPDAGKLKGRDVDFATGADAEDDLSLQKREAFARFSAVWQEALGDGIEPDILAHVALFAALRDMVATYGEKAVSDFAGRLPDRVANGEFTVPVLLH